MTTAERYRTLAAPVVTVPAQPQSPDPTGIWLRFQPEKFKRFDNVVRVRGGTFRTGFVIGAGPGRGPSRWNAPERLAVVWDDGTGKKAQWVDIRNLKLVTKGKK